MRSMGFAPCGEWVEPGVLEEPADVSPSVDGLMGLALAFGAEPGSYGIGVLSSLLVSLQLFDTAGLLELTRLWEVQAGWLASAQNEVLCALRDRAAADRAAADLAAAELAAAEMAAAAELAAAELAAAESGQGESEQAESELVVAQPAVSDPALAAGAAWLDAIAAQEEEAAALAAAQAPADPQEWIREDLAVALGLSGWDAKRRLATAVALRDRLPATAEALAQGRISWRHADVLATETDGLDGAGSRAVEQLVLADRRAVSVTQWRRLARKHAATVTPAVVQDAAVGAYESRSVRGWHAGDGVGMLSAQLTTEGLLTVTSALDELAVRTGPDDLRLVDARRADALVDLCAGYLAGGLTGLRAPTSGTRLVIDVPYATLLDNPLLDNPFTGGPLTGDPLAGDRFAGTTPDSGSLPGGGCPGGAKCHVAVPAPMSTGLAMPGKTLPGGAATGGGASTGTESGVTESTGEGSPGEGLADERPSGGGSAGGGLNGPVGSAPPTVHGEPIGRVAFERLSCDTELVRLVTDPRTGAVEDLGRTSRLPDARLRRAIEVRDGHRCTFPGCGRHGHLHAHHLQHWTHDGATDQSNLTLVCSRHHHAAHEGGWHVTREHDGQLTWRSPTGQHHTAPAATWQPPPDPPWPEQPWRAPKPPTS